MTKIGYFKITLLHCPLIANFTECEMCLPFLPYGFPANNTQKAKENPVHHRADFQAGSS